MKQLYNFLILTACFTLGAASSSYAQQLQTPRESQAATVSQKIGVSTITLNYSRPAVKGREIWGNLVKYGPEENLFGNGKPMPWRAGANENTTITFSHDVKIQGKNLKAGTYGLHMLASKDGEWTVIFSNDSRAWGSFFYEEANDALRVTAKPESSSFEEFLLYTFDEVKSNSALVTLRWEKLKISFLCEFDTDNLVLDDIRQQLTGAPGFSWQNWNQAGFYCLSANKHLAQGEQWIRKSISMNKNSTNSNLLAYILKAQNKKDEAMKLFRENTETYPEDWNVFDSYGEVLAADGNTKDAKKYYQMALEKAPKNQKPRLEKIISGLK